MDHGDEHDDSGNGERESRDKNRSRSTSDGGTPQSPKLVPVKGTGLSGPFIRRPVMTVLLTLSVIVAGIATYNKLAVNDLPAVDYPIIQVTCAYPGADPVTMANNIATPLEKQFLQIPGLDIITSQSTQGNTSLTLQFVLSKSITDAATDVQAAIQRATGKLPVDLPSPPTFTKTNPNDQAVYLVGFMSDTLTDGDLYKYASTVVAQRMSILPGVSQVNIYGVQGAIRIKADPAALASRGLTMDDLANAIKAGTVYSGAGQFDGPHRTFVLQPNGQIDQAEGYRNLIVARNKDRSPVYLRDIAEVKQSVQDERTSRFFWARGFNPARFHRRLRGFAAGGRECCRSCEFSESAFSRAAREPAGIDFLPPGVRSFANNREFGARRAGDPDDRVRAGSDGDLHFSRPRHRHADSGCRTAAFVAAHLCRDVHARLLH